MKKMTVVAVAISLAVSMFSIAYAGCGKGMGGGCGNCEQGATAGPSDPFRKFQSDTLDLRQEMMLKRFEVQRENLKATPDAAKVAVLHTDIKSIQSKIQAIRDQSGLPVGKRNGECGQSMGGCNKMDMGGKGMGGCNGPCGGQK